MTDLHWMTAAEAAQAIADRKLSPVELTTVLLDRITRLDPTLHAFIRLDAHLRVGWAQTRARARRGLEPCSPPMINRAHHGRSTDKRYWQVKGGSGENPHALRRQNGHPAASPVSARESIGRRARFLAA